MADDDLVSATGLALAAIAGLIERPDSVPKGEIARCLALLAESAGPDRPRQGDILRAWAQLLSAPRSANQN
jgi:hypothetical protein